MIILESMKLTGWWICFLCLCNKCIWIRCLFHSLIVCPWQQIGYFLANCWLCWNIPDAKVYFIPIAFHRSILLIYNRERKNMIQRIQSPITNVPHIGRWCWTFIVILNFKDMSWHSKEGWISLKCRLDSCLSVTLIDTHILRVKGTAWPLNYTSILILRSVLRLIELSLLFSAVAFLPLLNCLRECC